MASAPCRFGIAGKSQSPQDGEVNASTIGLNGGERMKTTKPYVLAAAFLLSACEKARLNQEVDRLCRIDGGRMAVTVRNADFERGTTD